MSEPKKKWLDRDNVNLMVAVCAVLISAASFYATYVQSTAAERQVKAETWPYLQLTSGNYDIEARELKLYMDLENAGVGPAHVKTFQLFYDGTMVRSINQVLQLCCMAENETARDENGRIKAKFTNIVTGSPAPSIIPAGEENLVYSITKNDANGDLWEILNVERLKLTARGCYCSLLDECYATDFESEPVEVTSCSMASTENESLSSPLW